MKHVPEQVVLGTRHPLYMAYLRALHEKGLAAGHPVTWDEVLEHSTDAEFFLVAGLVAMDHAYDPVLHQPPLKPLAPATPRRQRRAFFRRP